MSSFSATMPLVTTQPGYDELASAYDAAFPAGYASALERHAVALFVDEVVATGLSGPLVDVGCGTGHIAFDIASRGLDVVGLDPSTAMLTLAEQRYPDMRWLMGDASLSTLPEGYPALAGIIARFSLIHVEPQTIPDILAAWVRRLRLGANVMVAFQCSEDSTRPVREFDHRVARAWRWHPDAMATEMSNAGLSERWRVVTQPDDVHRFTECHLAFRLSA
jgi:ubiquinone/menaquinone biosynthesis C-methylase UbiE